MVGVPLFEISEPVISVHVLAALYTVSGTGQLRKWAPWPVMLAIDVRLPPLPGNAVVVIFDSTPIAYIAAFAPPQVRFVGAQSNIIKCGTDTPMQRLAEAAISGAAGALWSLKDPSHGVAAEQTLAYYKLARTSGCVQVISNLDENLLRMCHCRVQTKEA